MTLKGVLQKFDNKHNGRIYKDDLFEKYILKHYQTKLRKEKIKRVFNG